MALYIEVSLLLYISYYTFLNCIIKTLSLRIQSYNMYLELQFCCVCFMVGPPAVGFGRGLALVSELQSG